MTAIMIDSLLTFLLPCVSCDYCQQWRTHGKGSFARVAHYRNRKISISAIICRKLSLPPPPVKKLWKVTVGCHDCNCSICPFRVLWALDLRKRSALLIPALFGALCLSFTDPQKQMFRVSPPLKKFLHTSLTDSFTVDLN